MWGGRARESAKAKNSSGRCKMRAASAAARHRRRPIGQRPLDLRRIRSARGVGASHPRFHALAPWLATTPTARQHTHKAHSPPLLPSHTTRSTSSTRCARRRPRARAAARPVTRAKSPRTSRSAISAIAARDEERPGRALLPLLPHVLALLAQGECLDVWWCWGSRESEEAARGARDGSPHTTHPTLNEQHRAPRTSPCSATPAERAG